MPQLEIERNVRCVARQDVVCNSAPRDARLSRASQKNMTLVHRLIAMCVSRR